MILKIQHFVTIITFCGLISCSESGSTLAKIDAGQISIDSTISEVKAIETFTAPYRERIDEVLDSALAFAPANYGKTDGKYNTTAGNLMADIVMAQADPIFNSRTGNHIDFVLLNHGGIRAPISKGTVTARTAYEVMPFENTIVVVELSAESVLDMVDYLIQSKRAHPISKELQLVLKVDGSLSRIRVNGEPLDKDRNYFVATSNYLVTGGDNMGFFKDGLAQTETDYFIRNAMIDYFKKVDTLSAEVDNRFYILK